MSELGDTGEGGILAAETPSAHRLRRMLEDAVVHDLLGPANGPEEEFDEFHVSERYLAGMLAPRKQRVGAELLDALEVSDEAPEDGPAETSTRQMELGVLIRGGELPRQVARHFHALLQVGALCRLNPN